MINVNLNKKFTVRNDCHNCFIKGYSFYEGKLYKGREFLNLIDSCNSEIEFSNMIKKLNGMFLVIKIGDDFCYIAADRLRSYPVFYSIKNKEIYISDDAQWIINQIKENEIDELSKTEFLMCGYVSGPDTLNPKIKQVQAGEILFIYKEYNGYKIKPYRYYRFIHYDYFNIPEEELLKKMDEIMIKIFERLMNSVNNRTIIVPLSGGYDSRLIVLMLKRLGYDKVICFSYGKAGNIESEISKMIAKQLNFEWIFVEYSNSLWYKWYNSEKFKKYSEYAGGISSVAHIQDWPAVMYLKEKNLIPNDSIFVPGHSGDFLAGSHIPKKFYRLKHIEREKLLNEIINYHYNLQCWEPKFRRYKTGIKNKISDIIGDLPVGKVDEATSAFELWDWQERQSKFICNSVRVYEFWGYEFRLPLWDNELMLFYERVPLEERFNKVLYDKYIISIQNKIMGWNNISNKKFKTSFKKLLKNMLIKFGAIDKVKYISTIYKKINYKREYYNHPLSWYGIMTEQDFKRQYTGKENINSFLAKERMKLLN